MWTVLLTFFLSLTLVYVARTVALRFGLFDKPNARSMHTTPVPRLGGISIFVPILIVLALLPIPKLYAVCGSALFFLGLIDDFRPLKPKWRLFFQIIASATCVYAAQVPFTWWPIFLFWMVGTINAFNFMDGIDGIAALQAAVVGLWWSVIGRTTGSYAITLIGVVLACASCGFLMFNWHPAKIFMGDSGSTFLGFCCALLPLLLWTHTQRPFGTFWVWNATLWPFLADTGLTLIRRIYRRAKFSEAHRDHFYQRLVLKGIPVTYVTTGYALAAIVGGALAAGSLQ